MIGRNIETVLVLGTISLDTGLEVIASWRSDGVVGSRVDCSG